MKAWFQVPLTLAVGLFLIASGPRAVAVPPEYKYHAIEQGLVAEVLYAIALAESNDPGSDIVEPWPFTLNIDGDGFYFDSEASALVALDRALSEGADNIDVCEAQISIKYNGHRLPSDSSTWLDRWVCVKAAAAVLKSALNECFAESIYDIWCGVGRYHSPTESRAQAYALRVQSLYEGLVSE